MDSLADATRLIDQTLDLGVLLLESREDRVTRGLVHPQLRLDLIERLKIRIQPCGGRVPA